MQKTLVQSLSQEDPLEKQMTIHSIILTMEIPWTEEPGGLQPTGSQRVGHFTERLHFTDMIKGSVSPGLVGDVKGKQAKQRGFEGS